MNRDNINEKIEIKTLGQLLGSIDIGDDIYRSWIEHNQNNTNEIYTISFEDADYTLSYKKEVTVTGFIKVRKENGNVIYNEKVEFDKFQQSDKIVEFEDRIESYIFDDLINNLYKNNIL